LVAIDGSEPSMRAASYAILLAGKFEAQLWAIHVEQDVSYVNPYSFGIYYLITTDDKNSILHDRLKGTKEWFDKIKTSAYHNKVQLTKTELVVSSVSDQKAIANYAKRNGINVLVMGTQGLSGPKKLILGSVVSGVINHAHCPIMVVK
jgi:nucleotide-binding universal stress UspA family protein